MRTSNVERCVLVGGGHDGLRVDLGEPDEQMEFAVASKAGVPAVEVYRRRRINGLKIVAGDGSSVFDFALRRRAPEAVRT